MPAYNAGTEMVRVAIGQMTSTSNKLENFEVCARLVKQAASAGASFLALPECFNFIGERWTDSVEAAESLTGPSLTRYRELAKESGIWLSLGGFQEVVPRGDNHSPGVPSCEGGGGEVLPPSPSEKVFNTHVIISGTGEVKAAYRKIHLFDVSIPGGAVLMESRNTEAGREMVVCADTPAGTLGMSICYDLRFPEMYACLAAKGCQVMLVPSAFTVPTGKAHWEVLLRARAIETQAYVIASAQVGRHNEKRASYGHAMIVDPWGEVLADAGGHESPCLRTAEIDISKVAEVRARMPIREHRQAAGPVFAEYLLHDTLRKSGL